MSYVTFLLCYNMCVLMLWVTFERGCTSCTQVAVVITCATLCWVTTCVFFHAVCGCEKILDNLYPGVQVLGHVEFVVHQHPCSVLTVALDKLCCAGHTSTHSHIDDVYCRWCLRPPGPG
jgi:hypothetical protein